jgi:translation initiation factor IF-3
LEDKKIATPFQKKPFKPNPNFDRNNNNKAKSYQNNNKAKEEENRINEEITASRVRIVGENIENPGIYKFTEAIKMAQQMNLDLIEISPDAEPPVCRIEDYQKFVYQRKKKEKEQKAKAAKIVVKEVRFGPNTDEHDYQFKLKHAKSFLEEGAKVKAYVFFKGRSILFTQQGEILLLRFANDLEEYGKIEQLPKLEGKRMTIFMNPKPKKKN